MKWLRLFLLLVLFAALTALFTILLRPLVPVVVHGGAGAPTAPPVDGWKATPGFGPSVLLPRHGQPASAPAATAAVPSPSAEKLPVGPKVAIIVTELGLDPGRERRMIDRLPPQISLAFLPAAAASHDLAVYAALQGREVWIGLPMQPRGWPRISPGEGMLKLGDPPARNARRVEWALGRIDNPMGAYVMMGSAFTTDAAALAPVAQAVRRHGIVLLDTRSTPHSRVAAVVGAAGGRVLVNNIFIDHRTSAAAIDANLAQLVAQARRHGTAIGLARALPVTVERVSAWAATLDKAGVTLVPAARLAR